ncbi:hypothetical protein [Streptomyces sp. WAC06614]|uniref:hypothetical protein n=1 Tax=Streptomyces sp. WAC06614 TaxID=2487416 RepID=UPI000F76C917|nr:hypothetical protein [Streptomyces sp. WAC06614]RSS72781.1 hypothetical protein EF918_26260 [Streptomyces sp. WAC06614]
MQAQHRLATLAAATFVTAAVVPALAPWAAYARPSASVSPTSVTPGSRVGLTLTGCGTGSGRATSTAFGEVTLSRSTPATTNLVGSATVYQNATVKRHYVTFQCDSDGKRVTETLDVVRGSARGGLGGSTKGISPGQIALGGSLVAAALGSGVWCVRRRTHGT